MLKLDYTETSHTPNKQTKKQTNKSVQFSVQSHVQKQEIIKPWQHQILKINFL